MYPKELQSVILAAARAAVSDRICGTSELDTLELKRYQDLHETRGVFVTLKHGESLRGCIGIIIGSDPLYEAIPRIAVESAVEDPRFYPLRCPELSGITFEVSILTPLKDIDSYEQIVLGRDGILLTCRGRRSVFLPQVAVEQNWGLEETLNHLALKAGLPEAAWREGSCSFAVFQAEVFREGK